MEMEITFPGGARVDAHFGSFTINTDQSSLGGGEDRRRSPLRLSWHPLELVRVSTS